MMKKSARHQVKTLWQLSVRVTPEAEDAVTELLAAMTGENPSSYTDFDSQVTHVSVYLKDASECPKEKLTWLAQQVRKLARFGLSTGRASVSLRRLAPRSWKDSWKRHFKPIEFGARLLIRPSWYRRKVRKGQCVVILDPGLSFGTGQHPTTGFCLQQLVRFRRAGEAQSCLDIGIGSGILAISAAKLGYTPVDGFDLDPECLRVGRANARSNRVHERIRFRLQDLAALPVDSKQKYSVVCANLIADVLILHKNRILARVAPEGILLLAGILAAEFDSVGRAYQQAGARLVQSRLQKEWRSGMFAWR